MRFLRKSDNSLKYDDLPVTGKRPLFFAAVFMLTGILFAKNTGANPVYSCVFAAILLLGCVVFAKYKYSAVLLLFSIMLFSGAYYSFRTLPPKNDISKLGSVRLEGRVEQVKYSEKTDSYLLRDVYVNGESIEEKVYLTTRKTGYLLDDIIISNGSVSIPKGASYPGDFDYKQYLLSKGAAYTSFSYDTGRSSHAKDAVSFVNDIRYAISNKTDELFFSDSGVAKAFILGMTEDIEEELTKSYRSAGISHVLCVSGLHVGFIYLIFDFISKKLKLIRKLRFAVTTAGVVLFMLMSGLSSSVSRAGIMLIIFSLSQLFGERSDGLSSLGAAFILSCVYNPAAVFSASFQLSFAAVFSMIALGGTFSRLFSFIKFKIIREAVSSSLLATLGTFPILFQMNGSFYFPSVIINVFVIPFCSVLIPLVLIVTLIYCVFGGATVYLAVPLRYMIKALNGVSKIGEATGFLNVNGSAVLGVSIICFFIILFIASDNVKVKTRLKAGVCAAFLIIAAAGYILPKTCRDNLLTVVDSENSDFSVLTADGKCVLIDTGKDESSLEYLKKQGLKPDIILITAADERKVGGISYILEYCPTAEVYSVKSVIQNLKTEGFTVKPVPKALYFNDISIYTEERENEARVTLKKGEENIITYLEDKAESFGNTLIIKTYLRGKRQKYNKEQVYTSGARYAIISSASEVSEDTKEILKNTVILNTYTAGNITVDLNDKTEVRSAHEG